MAHVAMETSPRRARVRTAHAPGLIITTYLPTAQNAVSSRWTWAGKDKGRGWLAKKTKKMNASLHPTRPAHLPFPPTPSGPTGPEHHNESDSSDLSTKRVQQKEAAAAYGCLSSESDAAS